MKKKKLQLQQGDVLLEKVIQLPSNKSRLNHLTLAEGEVTGHAHRVEVLDGDTGIAELFREEKGNMYLSVKNGQVTLTHEEHGNITLEEGIYKIGIVQEYDYETEESKNVMD